MSQDPIFDRAWTHIRAQREGHIATISLHRPEAKNALNDLHMRELIEVAQALRLRHDIRAVILTGGTEGFSAGADLNVAKTRVATPPTLIELRSLYSIGPDLCKAWEEIEAVTIVAVEGFCIGGGCALAVSCDFRIMAEGAYMRLPEIPLGMNMSWRSIPRIANLVGPARAKQFVMFGEPADDQTCLTWGMAEEVTPKGEALAAAQRWAQKVVALPPIPVRMTKEAVNATVNANNLATSVMDRDQYLLMARSNDYREGVSAYLQKRTPDFKGD